MKQIVLRRGAVRVEDIPAPGLDPNRILVEVSQSLISTGTELSTLQNSRQSLLDKVKSRPQDAAKLLRSLMVRGIKRTYELILNRMEEGTPLGYSLTGTVLAVGSNVRNFRAGDRIACAGAGFAHHAEIVSVPENLTVAVPPGVPDRSAAFVTVGAIALQGVRRADPRLGETVGVIGLGLIGQITVQLLTAAGCRVVGLDPDASRIEAAMKSGMNAGVTDPEQFRSLVKEYTGGMGVDATLLTASTASSDPTRLGFEVTRKKGRIIVVGAVGLELQRSPFYEKEQDFLISCSYGPGRYDSSYEDRGQDYPYAYVRWTENRNMQAFLDLVRGGKISVEPLIGEEFPVDEAPSAYAALEGNGRRPLAVLISYPQTGKTPERYVRRASDAKTSSAQKIRLGLIGAGEFTRATHVPNLRAFSSHVDVVGVCTGNGTTAQNVAKQVNAGLVTTDYEKIIGDASINAVLIATRHDKHARIAEAALRAGKHVYLEKPLALTIEELESLEKTIGALPSCPVFMVGFNRRFAPMTRKLIDHFKSRDYPLVIQYRVNAGQLPADHWTKTSEGGGRLRGEACHMIDYLQFLASAPIASASIHAVRSTETKRRRPDENFSAQFEFADGSVAALVYTSSGHPGLPKEFIEVHGGGKSAQLLDFSELRLYGPDSIEKNTADKGHAFSLEAFFNAVRDGRAFPIPWEQLRESAQAAIELDREVWGEPR